MVYLTRSMRILKFDEAIEESSKKLIAHFRTSYPQIKDMRFVWNVTGRLDEMHWLLAFDSLAAEDDWAAVVMGDPVYGEWFTAMDGKIGDIVDHLFRDIPGM